MMGRTHALTGVLAGLLVGPSLGLDTIPELGPFAATVAGYALLPDIDHPSSTVSRSLGPVTAALSFVLRKASGWLYKHTKGPRDEPGGTHRYLTHTWVFASVLGGLCSASTSWWGAWAVAAWLLFGVHLAVDRLGKLVLLAFAAGAAAWLPVTLSGERSVGDSVLGALAQSSGWLGIAVALGCAVHCLGDAVTELGCAFLWPLLRWRGENWVELRLPSWLRFRTNKVVENVVVFPAVALASVWFTPGVSPYLITIAGEFVAVISGVVAGDAPSFTADGR
jgi:membrane-bound metal-dependent hydrolase YbcI (DUF457 family)